MHSGYRSRRPWKYCRFIQFSKTTGRRTPTRAADGHADSHDEYGMGLCKRICKLLRMQSEIVVIVIHGDYNVLRRMVASRKPSAKSEWHWARSRRRSAFWQWLGDNDFIPNMRRPRQGGNRISIRRLGRAQSITLSARDSVDSGRVNTASEMSPCRERLSFPRLRAGGARLPFLRTRRRLTLQILSQLSAGAKFNCLRRIRVRLYVIANLSSYQLVASWG